MEGEGVGVEVERWWEKACEKGDRIKLRVGAVR